MPTMHNMLYMISRMAYLSRIVLEAREPPVLSCVTFLYNSRETHTEIIMMMMTMIY